jgi:hypothetical protein
MARPTRSERFLLHLGATDWNGFLSAEVYAIGRHIAKAQLSKSSAFLAKEHGTGFRLFSLYF